MNKQPSHSDRPIYLDHNATTPLDGRVVEAMSRSLAENFGNPSSAHLFGRHAREAIEVARSDVALLLGCQTEEVFFTGGGTESDNLALKGVAHRKKGGHIVTCQGEHPAILDTCVQLEKEGYRVTRVPVDHHGQVDPREVASAITPDTVLISVMHANNETGTIQPVREIGETARQRGIPFHSDAAQSVGKIPVQVDDLQVDLLTVAGHKVYGPKGVGVLYVRRGTELEPFIQGGGQEGGLSPGTEPVHQIVGLGTACRIAWEELARFQKRVQLLRDKLHQALLAAIPGLSLNGQPRDRLPNTLNVNFPGVAGADLLARAEQVAASTGSACHTGETRLSPVLSAMGIPPDRGRGAVRLSLGHSSTTDGIEAAGRALTEAYAALTEKGVSPE